MCKAHSKATHIKQQKYFHHLKGRGYNNSLLYPGRLRWWKYICCFVCVTLLWALHIVIKQQFFYIFQVSSTAVASGAYSVGHTVDDWCLSGCRPFFSSPYSYNFSSIFAKTWHTCSVYYTHKTGFFSNFAFRIFGQFLIFFQTANSSYSFFSDSDEIWHTRCMYQCTKKLWNRFSKFWLRNLLHSSRSSCLDR